MTDIQILGKYEKLIPKAEPEVIECGYFLVNSGKSLLEARLFKSETKGPPLGTSGDLIRALRQIGIGNSVQVYQGNELFLEMPGPLTRFRSPDYKDLAHLSFQVSPDQL